MGISRHRVLPYLLADSAIDFDLLDEYRPYLGDEVILSSEGPESIQHIEKIESLGFKVIPIFSMMTPWGAEKQEPRDLKSYVPSSECQEYLDFLESNKERFPRILFANCKGGETCTPSMFPWYFYFGSCGPPNTYELDQLERRYSCFPKKAFAPFATSPERDAWRYKDNPMNSPLYKFMKRYSADMMIIFCGYWNLFKNFKDQRANGYHRYSAESGTGPWIDPSDFLVPYPDGQGKYPFQYYSDYLKFYADNGIKTYSGIGYRHGAEMHNAARIIDAGYHGVLFYISSREDLESYLTDVEEWIER